MKSNALLPEGEKLRRAIRWISDMKQAYPERSRLSLFQDAELKFDLTPKESLYLNRFLFEKPMS